MNQVVDILFTDVINFCRDMATLPLPTQIWAQMFPFPQFYLGLASIFWAGPCSVGAWYLYVRAESFVVAGQVHKRMPFSKLMGPIMHALFYILVPYAIWWLTKGENAPTQDDTWKIKAHYWFVVYTTCITTIALLADTGVLIKYLQGKDVGTYKHGGSGTGSSGEYEQIT